VLPFPIFNKSSRLLTGEPLTCSGLPFGGNFGVIGWCGGAERSWDADGQTTVFREAAAEGGEVATQLFDESLALKLNSLTVALQRAQRLVELLLARAEATLRLFVCCNLALNLNLQGRLRLHALFTLRCRGSGCCCETRLLGELGTEVCDTRLQGTTLLCGSRDSGRGTGNGGIATCARQLPGAQGRSICFHGSCEVRAAGGQLFNAGAPLGCSVSGDGLLRGKGNLIESCLGGGDGGIKATDSFSAL
jgi:hypothetical protein